MADNEQFTVRLPIHVWLTLAGIVAGAIWTAAKIDDRIQTLEKQVQNFRAEWQPSLPK
jgi:hypothetical protein